MPGNPLSTHLKRSKKALTQQAMNQTPFSVGLDPIMTRRLLEKMPWTQFPRAPYCISSPVHAIVVLMALHSDLCFPLQSL